MDKPEKKEKSAQPPPRKGKVATALRNNHSEQLLKLQMKHQQDSDFLEDIRNFTKMRAAVEKEYAQALLKLATTYLQRKGPIVNDFKTESGESYKTVYSVWRTLLDETEKIAKARLAATEVYQQQVSEGAKGLRMYKLQVAKKCFDNLRKMHDEIQTCVVEIDKSKKLYFEEEHMAHDAREKAADADEKLRRKKGRIFQSISSLQKNSAKFSFRREACDIQATKARNDYVLALVAANAHQMKFSDSDLPELINFLDCDIYDRVKEYILLISRTELLTCAACQSSFTVVEEQANMAAKQYTMECFFKDNPVLSQPLLYDFEPCDNDKIHTLSTDHNAGLCLSKEARRWATCVAKEVRVIKESKVELKKLLARISDKPPYTICEPGPQADIELRIDELRMTIRRAQTSKKKADARLDAMRDCGVNVDEWMRTSVDSESVSTVDNMSTEALSRAGTLTSRASQKITQVESYEAEVERDDAFYESDVTSEPQTAGIDNMSEPAFPELASAVDVVAAVQSAWDAAAEAHEEEEEVPMEEPVSYEPEVPQEPEKFEPEPKVNGEVAPAITYTRCVASFSYQANNADELSFVEQEELELISEGDGDGWIKARNYRGEEGYIPQNYVEIVDQAVVASPRPPLTSFSSVDYSVPLEEEEEEELAIEPPIESKIAPPNNFAMVNGEIVQLQPVNVQELPPSDNYAYCRAVYDYEATCDEELNFIEGQVIRILDKNVTDVDDGWWEGELNGVIGLFPSLVVEELRDNGEPMTPIDITSPPESAPPPAFTPPEPQMLILPDQVILTQPTPEIENPHEKPPLKKTFAILDNQEFHIELTEKQQSQYDQQFAAGGKSKGTAPAEEEVEEEEEEVMNEEEEEEEVVVVVPPVPSLEETVEPETEEPKEVIRKKSIREEVVEVATKVVAEVIGDAQSSIKAAESECPTVVITEVHAAPFDDEFIYREEVIIREEVKQMDGTEIHAKESETEKVEPAIEEEVVETKKEESGRQKEEEVADVDEPDPNAFECTFPDMDEFVPQSEPFKVKTVDSASKKIDVDKSEQDPDVKMEVNSDTVENGKMQNDFFEVTG